MSRFDGDCVGFWSDGVLSYLTHEKRPLRWQRQMRWGVIWPRIRLMAADEVLDEAERVFGETAVFPST